MSLAKLSLYCSENEEEKCKLRIHDLYLDYVRRKAGRTCALWNKRLLNGHRISDASSADATGNNHVLRMLDYTPRAWWIYEIENKEYIRRNVCRHLHNGDLIRELGAVIIDLRWIDVQAHTGGFLGLKNDCNLLNYLLSKKSASHRSSLSTLQTIVNPLERFCFS